MASTGHKQMPNLLVLLIKVNVKTKHY